MTYVVFFISVGCITLFSCKQAKSDTEPQISLTDSADFRKSYAAIMFDSTADPDVLQIKKPNLMKDMNPFLKNKLNHIGIMDKDSLITSVFRPFDSIIHIKDHSGRSLQLGCEPDNITGGHVIRFQNQQMNDSLVLSLTGTSIEIAFADMFPGGYPEIFILENIYVVNGDNFYLKIYKIKE
ncbi:MAG: hypothetical protein H7Y86_17765 [Rhizobacter sp.]|nr:hypothetical protein [Ferruginibacter sp.]